MGKLIVHMFMTLDGVVQAPGEPDEELERGLEHGGRQVPHLDEESGKVMVDHYEGLEALPLGRKTYEIFAPYWSHAPADHPFTALMNSTPKFQPVAGHVGLTVDESPAAPADRTPLQQWPTLADAAEAAAFIASDRAAATTGTVISLTAGSIVN